MDFNRIHEKKLAINDEPFVLTNFMSDPEKYLDWNKVDSCLYRRDVDWELIHESGFKVNIPKTQTEWYGETLDAGFISREINMGRGFVIAKYGQFDAKTSSFLSEIEHHFFCAADIHVYGGTESSSSSFNAHCDATSNFIIQVEGETPWKVYKNKFSHIACGFEYYPAVDEIQPEIDVVLKPGDLLYIPQRRYHKAHPTGKRLSMSVAMRERKHNSVLINRGNFTVNPLDSILENLSSP